MIGKLLLISLILFSSSPVFAAPQIYVQRPAHNFGNLVQGKKLDHTFIIKNIGDAPLKILHIRPACGCTAANASSPVVAPGKTSEIKVSFNSSNFYGTVSKTIALESNDPVKPAYTLTLTGNIIEEVSIKPKQLNLGKVKPGIPMSYTINIENMGSSQLKINSVKSPMPQLTIRAENNLLKPGEVSKISITANARPEDRILSGYITISTDNPDKKEITVPVYGSLVK